MRLSPAVKWAAVSGWVLVIFSAGIAHGFADVTTGEFTTGDVASGEGADRKELEARIAVLIEQLGSPQYHAREKAQEDLKRLGARAIDALLAAQEHVDTEIAMRARYLVRSVPIEWTKEGDAAEVRQLLQDYSDKERDERRLRARHLATLEHQNGVAALSRIMRYDPDPILSKHAAVMVLRGEWPGSEKRRREIAEQIRAEVSDCRRPAASWLLAYARSLESPIDALDDWFSITSEESSTFARSPRNSDREIVRDLYRWQAEMLMRLERREEAADALRRTFDLVNKDRLREDLYELLDWSIQHRFHQVVDEMSARFATQFRETPHLLYGLAESQLKRGEPELAEETAARALRIHPNETRQHWAVGFSLLNRVLTDWAEQEFRYVISRTKVEDPEGASYRWMFANRLFDWGKELEAGDMAKSVVDAANANPQLYDALDPFEAPDASDVQGYMHYFYGMHFARENHREKQIEHFSKAIELAPTNTDFLIAMYRVPDPDQEWSQDVKKRIDAMGGQLRTEMRELETALQRPMDNDQRSDFHQQLARKCNELAWLISNTEGDFKEAVAASLRSLELHPDTAAYLDTLGRCYYAAGDYEKAVEHQALAVKKMPTMHIMRRQLAFFEQELAESKSKPK